MRKFVVVALAIFLAAVGMGYGQDFIQGEAKGADAPGAMLTGSDQSWNGTPLQLSRFGAEVFDSAFFNTGGWAFDVSGSSVTPSQSAFLKDRPADGKPLIPAKKAAYVGAKSMGEDPREA